MHINENAYFDDSSEISGMVIEDQFFSSSLLRLWRTGADQLLYSSSEDGDLDVSNTKSSYSSTISPVLCFI